MSERYWEGEIDLGPAEELLMDLISRNVAGAIKCFWEEAPPNAWIDDDLSVHDNGLKLTVAGPPKVDDTSDIYTVQFDLFDEFELFAMPYDDIGGPRGEEQQEDMKQRAAIVREFAQKLLELADRADTAAKAS